MPSPSGRVVRAVTAVLAAGTVATWASGAPSTAAAWAAGKGSKGPTADVWAERVCQGLVGFQAAGLDARDVLRGAVAAPPPVDRATRHSVIAPRRAAVTTVRDRLRSLDRTLARTTP